MSKFVGGEDMFPPHQNQRGEFPPSPHKWRLCIPSTVSERVDIYLFCQHYLRVLTADCEQKNMQFNSMKFNFLSFSHHCSSSNTYLTQDSHIVKQDHNIKDLGIFMSDDLTFSFHTIQACYQNRRLSGSILGSFFCNCKVFLSHVNLI